MAASLGDLSFWIIDATWLSMNISFAFGVGAVLRLMAMQVDVVIDAPNSIARLDCLAGLFTSAIPHPTLDGFLCGT
jgi:hypothetical protein